MPSNLPSILVRLSAQEKKAVAKAAKSDGRSVSDYVRWLLKQTVSRKRGERE